MRHMGRHERGTEEAREDIETRHCSHAWVIRDITFALPGRYETEVCGWCGALRIVGPAELDDPQCRVWTPERPWMRDGVHLEDLARRWSSPSDGQ